MVTRSMSRLCARRVIVLLVGLMTALGVVSAAPATAASLVVDCPSDSLQDAIDAAAPGDSISVTGICDENITIDKDVSISGGIFEATIDGGARGSVVTIAPGVSVTLDGLTIRNGLAVLGGGILNHGTLHVADTGVTGNRARFGGGLFVAGGASVELVDSIVSDNWAEGQGGGLYLDASSTASLVRTSLSDNTARTGGGGASVRWDAPFAVTYV